MPKPPFVMGPVAPGGSSTVVECRVDTVPTAAHLRLPLDSGQVDRRGRIQPLRDRLDTLPTGDQLMKSPTVEHPHDTPGSMVDLVPAGEPRRPSEGGFQSDSDEDWVSDDEHCWDP